MTGAAVCLACGEQLHHDIERALCVCGECLSDQREDDHDATAPSGGPE